jgi:nitrate/TMAO reductase-like tetraheme cytochrome c subunit
MLRKQIQNLFCLFIAGIALFPCMNSSASSDVNQTEKPTPGVTYSNPYFKGTREDREAQIKKITTLFGVDCNFCHDENLTVFTEEGEISKEMMKVSVALGVECDYCHIDMKHYKENEQKARKMFELCKIMGTECSFCHDGKGKFTQKGERSKTAFVTRAWATEGTKQCLECHIEKKQFALNFYGWQVLNALKGLKGM